jgi:formylmethanofuran dehydrogenase subunit E
MKQFMEMLDVTTETEGRTLWAIIANRYVFVDGVQVETSTFRGNGGLIAEVCGGTYMDYYCASREYQAEKKIMDKFIDLNVSTRDINIAP